MLVTRHKRLTGEPRRSEKTPTVAPEQRGSNGGPAWMPQQVETRARLPAWVVVLAEAGLILGAMAAGYFAGSYETEFWMQGAVSCWGQLK